MRAFVKTRAVGVVGACGLVAVAVMLLLGDLTLAEAAQRSGILLGVVLALEHVLLPLARVLVGEPAPRGQEQEDMQS